MTVRGWIGVAAIVAGCASGARQAPEPGTAEVVAAVVPATLPSTAGARWPSLLDVDGQVAGLGDQIADVATCGGCHPDAFAQQQASAHAFSSFNNPIYRASIENLRDDVDRTASRMCGGCHDIALLVDGGLDAEVAPNDRRAHAGVTCRTCHGIASARRDGNGSYTLRARPIPIPDLTRPDTIEVHRRAAAPLRAAEMCGSCHRAFLSESTGNEHFLVGQDDYGAWLGSPYNAAGLSRVDEQIPAQTCIGCHMRREPATRGDLAARGDTIASHRFLGGHTWLAAMTGDREQLRRQQEFLRGVASIDIAAARDGHGRWTLPADGAAVVAGDELTLDVVIRNQLVGHRFPGGVLDAQDTWVELVLEDARGRRLAADGVEPGSGHVLRALVAGSDGVIRLRREVHQFASPIANYTLAPRDAMAVRYVWPVPARLDPGRLPVRARARLLHRTRNRELQALACAESRTERGRRFAARGRQLRDPVLDPCAPQPVTVIAEAEVWLGDGAAARQAVPARPVWSRLHEHGMALLHCLGEEVGDARPSLDAALAALAGVPDAARPRAMVLSALAVLESRLGRTAAVQVDVAAARGLVGPHPALAKIEADALAAVWRWQEAADVLAPAMAKVKANAEGWRAYAIALGSASRDAEALAAAQAGLALAPRQPDLLRVQALALRALGSPEADAALDSYDRHRDPDIANELRFRSDVEPVPVIRLGATR